MANYTKENLLSLTPANVPAGTLAMKVGNEVFTAGNTVIKGTDVSATTATADGVVKGLKFFNAYGTLTTGTLEVAGSSGSGEFYKCTEVRRVESADDKYIIVTGGSYDTITGTYVLENQTQTGINRKWVHVDNPLCSIYFDKNEYRSWVLFYDESTIRLVANSAANNPVDDASWQDMNNASNENLPQFAWNALPDIAFQTAVLELVEATPGKRKWHMRGEDSYLEENPYGDNEHFQLGYVPKWGFLDEYFSSTETDAPWEISVWDDPYSSSPYKYKELQLAPIYKEAQQRGEWSGQRAELKVDTREVQTYYYDIVLDFDGEFTHKDLATTFLFGGRFELLNPDLKGTNRIYSDGLGWYIKYRNGAWQIYQPNFNGSSLIGPRLVSVDPIGTEWDMTGSNLTHSNGTYIKTTKSEKSATKTEILKYYDFEDTVTNGLTWGKGFTPEVGGVYNADATVIAQVLPNPTDVWGELSNRVQSGQVELGEIIEVPNTALTDVGLVEGVIQFEVVAIDNADLVSITKAHSITLFAKKVLFDKEWDSGSHNKWSNSQVRRYLQNEFLNCLDAGFASHIQTVNRTHWLYGGGEETVQDTIFLPSYTEIGLGQNNGISEGVQWNKMTSDESRTSYWLSSACSNGRYNVWFMRSDGASGNGGCYGVYGIVPALVFA